MQVCLPKLSAMVQNWISRAFKTEQFVKAESFANRRLNALNRVVHDAKFQICMMYDSGRLPRGGSDLVTPTFKNRWPGRCSHAACRVWRSADLAGLKRASGEGDRFATGGPSPMFRAEFGYCCDVWFGSGEVACVPRISRLLRQSTSPTAPS